MLATDTAPLIDLIYEAAVVPELWPKALDAISHAVDGALGSLAVIPGNLGTVGDSTMVRQMKIVGTPAGEQLIADFTALNNPSLTNTRLPRVYTQRRPGFFGDLDLFEREEIDRDPFYQDFLRPRGYGWFAGTLIEASTGDSMILSFERQWARGPVEPEQMAWLDALRPHLARASFLALRLSLEKAREMADAMGRIGLATAVVRHGGRVLAANELFEALPTGVVRLDGARLRLLQPMADERLLRALAEMGGQLTAESSRVWSIPYAAEPPQPAYVFHVVPVRGSAQDIFQQATALVIATAVEPLRGPSAALIGSLFDLTPAESRVAERIGNGETVEHIATALGVSVFTVRAQLRAILDKTGVHRQADLVRLLAGGVLRGV